MSAARVDVAGELAKIARDMELELCETVRDALHPTREQMRRMELWNRLELLVERVEGGDPTSRQAPSLPPASDAASPRAVAARRVSTHHAGGGV